MDMKPGDEFNFLLCEEKPYPVWFTTKRGLNQKSWRAKFRCKCGMVRDLNCYSVKNGQIKSCGCINKTKIKPRVDFKRKFSKEELQECINRKMSRAEIAQKFNCCKALINLRMNEFELEKIFDYKEYIKSKNINNRLKVLDILKIKGKYKFECLCECGNKIILKPSEFKNKNISCGCLKPRLKGDLGKKIIGIIRSKAKERGLECTITLDYLKKIFEQQKGRCIYSNVELTFPTSWNDSSYNASLDRIDSSKGYIEGNVQWVTKRVNSMKNDMTEKEFIELCKVISDFRNKE